MVRKRNKSSREGRRGGGGAVVGLAVNRGAEKRRGRRRRTEQRERVRGAAVVSAMHVFGPDHKLKRWERIKCKPNSLPVLHKMHVKLGDTVKIISGHEKGKIGEVIRIFRHNSTVVVKDMNLKTKHMKSREQGEPGKIVKIEAPIHSSNVMLYSKEQQVASRVGHKVLEDGSRVRYLLKTGEIIDSKETWSKVTKEKKELEAVESA